MSPPRPTGDALPTVLISGTAGAGKSIVAKEIHELLRRAHAANAMIDLDAVGRVSPVADEPYNSHLVLSNLSSMWPNYESLDLAYLVLARALLGADELDAYRASFPFMDLRVVRLEVSDDEVRRRLQVREPGVSQRFLVDIAPGMADEMRSNDLDDLVVDNGSGRSVTDVALEVLGALEWPIPPITP